MQHQQQHHSSTGHHPGRHGGRDLGLASGPGGLPAGQLGVVSGTALEVVCARRLQLGDPGGHVRRALAPFPDPAVAGWILDAYFVEGGKAADRHVLGRAALDPRTQPHASRS